MSGRVTEDSDEVGKNSAGRVMKDRAGLLLLLPYPMLVVSFVETLRLPWGQFLDHYSLLPLFIQAWGEFFEAVNGFVFDLVVIQVVTGFIALLSSRHRLLLSVTATVGAIATTCVIYKHLISYPPFEGYLPFILGLTVFAMGIASCVYATFSRSMDGRVGRGFRIVMGGAAFAFGGSAIFVHLTAFPNQYPSLHLSLIALAVVSIMWGLYALDSATDNMLTTAPRMLAGLTISTACLVGITTVGAKGTMPDLIEPYLVSTSELTGQNLSDLAVTALSKRPSRDCSAEEESLSDSEAVALFFEHSGFPELEEEIPLTELNVLFVLVETTRFDDTNLDPDQALEITPVLSDLLERGAFNFVNAKAPSSNTLQSTSGIMTMTSPSMGPLTIERHHSSRGELREESFTAFTVAEYFQEMGHETFRAVHQAAGFPNRSGFDRGVRHNYIAERDGEDKEHAGVDERITERGLAFVDELAAGERPFFGWYFYWSPHHPYVLRNPDGDKTPRGRYRQEIRHVDSQIGDIIERLERDELLDETIVIIASDHGEEFGEHGGAKHSKTLYREVIHVPLLVWIPGVDGWAVEEPTSLSYLFTWLMLHAEFEPPQHFINHVRRTVAPSLVAADGTVVSELLMAEGGQISLRDEDHTIIHRIASGRNEVFNVQSDPFEQDDLFLSNSPEARDNVKRVERYLDFRACHEAFRVRWE